MRAGVGNRTGAALSKRVAEASRPELPVFPWRPSRGPGGQEGRWPFNDSNWYACQDAKYGYCGRDQYGRYSGGMASILAAVLGSILVLEALRQRRRQSGGRASTPPEEDEMSVAKVSEISATSTVDFEDAIKQGIARANKTLRKVRSAWIKEQHVRVADEAITEYQVNMMVTFVIDD
jgi:hypothetical protein